MKHYNNFEVILLSNHSSPDLSQKELIKWLTTILQPTIDKQQESIKKMFLKILKETPAIYLS
jgi:hypothetical protein